MPRDYPSIAEHVKKGDRVITGARGASRVHHGISGIHGTGMSWRKIGTVFLTGVVLCLEKCFFIEVIHRFSVPVCWLV